MPRTWLQIALATSFFALRLAGPAPGAAGASAPAPMVTQELVFGNGTAGPFPLSWTAVRFGSERLSVNGASLHFGLDYLLDYAAGTVSFSQPLRRDQIAQVEYVYDAALAKPNHAPPQVPLTMEVWGSGAGGLQMIGAVHPATALDGSPSASLLGFRGETALGGGQITSLFLLAPESNGSARSPAWRTAALQFGASRTTGAFQFKASVGQAGAGFAQAADYHLQQDLRLLDFSAAFDPSKRISLTSQVKRQEALDAAGKGQEQSSVTNQLTLSPSGSTKLTLSQESTSKARAQGGPETMDALRAQIVQSLGRGAAATALVERRRTDAAGTTTTTGVDLASQLADHTHLTAGFARSDNDRSGADTTSNLLLTMRPTAQLGFHLGFNQHLTQKQGSQVGTDWGLTAGRNGLLKIEGSTSEKVAAGGPDEQQDQLRVAATPLRGVTMAALTTTRQMGQDAARQTRETSLELSPGRELRVAGTYGEQDSANGIIHVRALSGTLKPTGFLDLSGAYKTREALSGDAVITRDVRLALTPVHGLKLQGSYVENPEDPDGQVRATTDTSLGLDSAIGSLVFGGSYTTGEGAAAAPQQREQAEFRLALHLWGSSRFYSTYKASEERAGSVTDDRTLTLGFTRSLSASFFLLLEGELTQVAVDGVPQPGLGDQRAQAKLGLRF